MASDNAFVYLLLDPRNLYIPFYVGKGSKVSRRALERPRFHLKEALRGKRSAKCDRIRSIIEDGEMYSIMIWQTDMTDDDAYNLEETLIGRFGRENYEPDGILTNIVIDNRRIDYSKIIYRKGADHHNYGRVRPIEEIDRQRTAWRKHAQLEGLYMCKCGCGFEYSWNQRNYASKDRRKHCVADWHFKDLPHNQAKSRKIKLLLCGFQEKDITPDMYMDKQMFNTIIMEQNQ